MTDFTNSDGKSLEGGSANSSGYQNKPAIEYFPPYRLFSKAISERAQDRAVTMPLSVFEMLLRQIFQAGGFDPSWYKAAYPDIASAIRSGIVRDEISHFVQGGYREERLPQAYAVDEDWYRHKYPDVDEGIKASKIPSARSHYNSSGYIEGRYPNAAAERVGEAWRRTLEALTRTTTKRF